MDWRPRPFCATSDATRLRLGTFLDDDHDLVRIVLEMVMNDPRSGEDEESLVRTLHPLVGKCRFGETCTTQAFAWPKSAVPKTAGQSVSEGIPRSMGQSLQSSQLSIGLFSNLFS